MEEQEDEKEEDENEHDDGEEGASRRLASTVCGPAASPESEAVWPCIGGGVIITDPCIFSIENHSGNIQGGA